MLSHVHIGVSDLERAIAFYGAVLGTLGLVMKFREDERAWAGWMSPEADRPLLIVGTPFDGQVHERGNGQMTALLARSRREVDECHAAALANGGIDEGHPGPRPEYHLSYYGAYFRDPDANKLCICCHDAE